MFATNCDETVYMLNVLYSAVSATRSTIVWCANDTSNRRLLRIILLDRGSHHLDERFGNEQAIMVHCACVFWYLLLGEPDPPHGG